MKLATHARSVVNAFCRANGRIGFRRKLITNESIDGSHGTTNKATHSEFAPSVFLHNLAKKRPPELLPAAFEFMAPHTGQSSQLVLDANDRNAQFLPEVARSLVCQLDDVVMNVFPSDPSLSPLIPWSKVNVFPSSICLPVHVP